MPKTALITGASSGLGAEFARQIAMTGADLVLVARDRDALEQVAGRIRAKYGVGVEVLPADLLKRRHLAKVVARIADAERPIELLVNNAGFGLPLDFASNDIDDEVKHLELHVEVPMRLSHAALGQMLPRGRGRIINVASVAGFIPRSTYGACKGWLIAFSRWSNDRYGVQGVTTTAVCPGFTHTSFHERMGLAKGKEGVPDWMWLDARSVVAEGLRDAARGKAVSIPSLRYRALIGLTRLLPASLAMRVGERGR
ncbi:SDR family NAD(P)-dependent oxidoreductase [Agromyces allii]|uniref:SDR family oxidoreductase n=1 Tax=Agromyces allii TaxID=393607 RepID=A0ABN2QQQ9_9MICO|nr:SDR family oxidoreductase [Agromyces allii]